jgi:hypothetical protein
MFRITRMKFWKKIIMGLQANKRKYNPWATYGLQAVGGTCLSLTAG